MGPLRGACNLSPYSTSPTIFSSRRIEMNYREYLSPYPPHLPPLDKRKHHPNVVQMKQMWFKWN